MAELREGARRLWDWRVAAVALGGLSTVAAALLKPIGVSTAYCTSWGMVLGRVAPEWAASHPYLKSVGTAITAEWMLVVGVVLGGIAASLVSRSRTREAVPAMWRERFGSSGRKRFLVAAAGGFLFLFGARLAGGCTSGHVISGLSQLALSGAVFAAAVFASAMLTARLLYGARRT